MKETNLLPKHLRPSYLPKIEVKEHFHSPISTQNKIKGALIVLAFALFYFKKDIEKQK